MFTYRAYIGTKENEPEATNMSTATPAPGPMASGRANRIGIFAMIRKLIAAISEGSELAQRYRMLTNLSNEELAALGLDRKDIPRVAVNGWKR
jgi:uncharacterized protein YjiS (DUF1127 family)